MDIKLDPITGDVSFENGESSFTSIGSEDLAQRLLIRLSTFQGEWFMDSTLGVDYFGKVFGKNRSKIAVDTLFQSEIMKEQDVLQITSFSSSISNSEYTLNFKVRTEDGAITAIPTITVSV